MCIFLNVTTDLRHTKPDGGFHDHGPQPKIEPGPRRIRLDRASPANIGVEADMDHVFFHFPRGKRVMGEARDWAMKDTFISLEPRGRTL